MTVLGRVCITNAPLFGYALLPWEPIITICRPMIPASFARKRNQPIHLRQKRVLLLHPSSLGADLSIFLRCWERVPMCVPTLISFCLGTIPVCPISSTSVHLSNTLILRGCFDRFASFCCLPIDPISCFDSSPGQVPLLVPFAAT